jgi:hypothetical protein
MYSSLEQRLVRLERTNRILITVLVVGLAAVGSLALTQLQQPTADELRAERFVLVDSATDQEVAVLSHDADGTFLRFADEGGKLELGVGSDRPRLVGEDQAGNQLDLFDRTPRIHRLRQSSPPDK